MVNRTVISVFQNTGEHGGGRATPQVMDFGLGGTARQWIKSSMLFEGHWHMDIRL
jgi:hypothetical protein